MAKKRRKPKMEFRYYQMSAGSPILALLGQKWVQNYGNDVDYLHFHNYLEIGYCMVAMDIWCWVKRKSASMEVSLQ